MKTTDYTHVFIDFDETLFSHGSYIEWFAEYLAKTHGIDTHDYMSSFDDYHDLQDEQGLLRMYRHDGHILDKTGLSWDMLSGEIQKAVRDESLDFCYPEAHKFLAELSANKNVEIRLLTYGNADYQRFKIGLCKHLQGIPVHVVREPKGEFLSRNYNQNTTRGVLIDDKAPHIMPSNWQHMWINRKGHTKPENAQCIEIVDLSGALVSDNR